jgi:hypothetical protein
MNDDELAKILGYEPSREQRLVIMRYARDHDLTPPEAANLFAFPVLLFVNPDGVTFDHEGETLTSDQLTAKYPHNKLVFIREQIDPELLNCLNIKR